MERIKNWFIKHKKLWLQIVDILFTLAVFFAGLMLGSTYCHPKSIASADPWAGDTATFDIPFGGLTYIPPGDNPSMSRVTISIPNFVGTQYGSSNNNELYFSNSFMVGGLYGQVDYYEYATYVDGYLTRDINVSSNPFAGFAGFSLVASDFVLSRSLIDYYTDYSEYFRVFDYTNDVSLLYKPTLSGLVLNPYNETISLVTTEITEQDVYRDDLNYWSMLDAFYLDCKQAIGATNDIPVLVSGFRMSIDLNTVLNGDATWVHLAFKIPTQVVQYRSTSLSTYNAYIASLVEEADLDILGMLTESINSILSIEIFPNVSFITLLSIALAIPLVVWLLKAWLGG